jgi:hypothetical protein
MKMFGEKQAAFQPSDFKMPGVSILAGWVETFFKIFFLFRLIPVSGRD